MFTKHVLIAKSAVTLLLGVKAIGAVAGRLGEGEPMAPTTFG